MAVRYNYGTSMISGRIGYELAVLAILCVLTIFFFPAMRGPYSVVYGPVTALQAARAALRVQVAMVQAAISLNGNFPISPLAVLSLMLLPTTMLEAAGSPERSTILRC